MAMTTDDIREFIQYLRNCTGQQVQEVHRKEMDALREDYAMLAELEAHRRGITLTTVPRPKPPRGRAKKTHHITAVVQAANGEVELYRVRVQNPHNQLEVCAAIVRQCRDDLSQDTEISDIDLRYTLDGTPDVFSAWTPRWANVTRVTQPREG